MKMKPVKKCPVCKKPNERGGNSKYCCGDCKMKADEKNKKKCHLKTIQSSPG